MKVVLGLQLLTDSEKIALAQQIAASMTANAALYGTSDPDAADITTAATAAQTALTAKLAAQQAAEAATAAKDVKFDDLETVLGKAASWAEDNLTTAVDIEKVYTLQKDREITTEVAQVEALSATYGDSVGEVDLGWDRVPRARSYEVQSRAGAAGTWAHAKTTSRSSVTVSGLNSGTNYQFRVRAIGPNELEGPWSDPAERMAP